MIHHQAILRNCQARLNHQSWVNLANQEHHQALRVSLEIPRANLVYRDWQKPVPASSLSRLLVWHSYFSVDSCCDAVAKNQNPKQTF